MNRQDIFDIGKHFIISELWIYKYYKGGLWAILQFYKNCLHATNTDVHKLSYELWLEARSGMFEPPTFMDWCIEMDSL